jgi:vacuolar-type H+-ATPase subunit I/STV1
MSETVNNVAAEKLRVTTSDGKYTVVMDAVGQLHALRHNEPWRELTGDNLVFTLAADLEESRAALSTARREHAEVVAAKVRAEEWADRLWQTVIDIDGHGSAERPAVEALLDRVKSLATAEAAKVRAEEMAEKARAANATLIQSLASDRDLLRARVEELEGIVRDRNHSRRLDHHREWEERCRRALPPDPATSGGEKP